MIDEELKKANERIQQGTPAAEYYQQWVIDKGLKTLGRLSPQARARRATGRLEVDPRGSASSAFRCRVRPWRVRAIPERNWVNIQWLARLRWAQIAGQAATVLVGAVPARRRAADHVAARS